MGFFIFDYSNYFLYLCQMENITFEGSVIHYLNEMYGDLEEYKINEYPSSIFFIRDKKVYMEQDLKNVLLWVDNDTIWEDLENIFSLSYSKVNHLITKWVEENYKLSDFKTQKMIICQNTRWGKLIN